jgi:hypothetical protein
MPPIANTVRADVIPEIDTVQYSHDADAAASIQTLRLAFRRLVAHPGLSNHQRRGIAHCLTGLEDFPLVNNHTCVQVFLGLNAIETDAGILSLTLNVSVGSGELEAEIIGSYRDGETGMHDSVTACHLMACGAGNEAAAQYDDYRRVHAHGVGLFWYEMPAFDAASFAILPLDDLAPSMEVVFPDDDTDDEPAEGPEAPEADHPSWTIRDDVSLQPPHAPHDSIPDNDDLPF